VAEVRIIAIADKDVGWMQTTPDRGAIFKHLYLERGARPGVVVPIDECCIGKNAGQRSPTRAFV
jgi:hypothetical protein